MEDELIAIYIRRSLIYIFSIRSREKMCKKWSFVVHELFLPRSFLRRIIGNCVRNENDNRVALAVNFLYGCCIASCYERNVSRHSLFNEISNILTALCRSFVYANEITHRIYSRLCFIVRSYEHS